MSKTIFITGCSSGIGRETVKLFQSKGWNVVATMRSPDISAQDHIHHVIIEEAKDQLKQTERSISEVAFSLCFEYPQYFSRLFKLKTGLTGFH